MKHLVAVYGSLLTNLGNHGLIKAIKAEPYGMGVVDDFNLYPYAGTSFPCIAEGTGQVVVEVYSTDDEGLQRLDGLEGYPRFYNRKQVKVAGSGGDADADGVWIYYHEQAPNQQAISHGDWKKFLEENKCGYR